MEVVPLSVGRVSAIVGRAGTSTSPPRRARSGPRPAGGFTGAVAGAAARFTTAWERHATGLAEAGRGPADGLRTAIADYLATDQAAGAELLRRCLRAYLRGASR